MLSKCPNCRSTFEIDDTQLRAANGLVRCGACLHVFNGQEESTKALSPATQQETNFSAIDQELEAIEAQINAITQKRKAPKVSQSIDEELADFAKIAKAFHTENESSTAPNSFGSNLSSSNLSTHLDTHLDTFDISGGKPEHFATTDDYLASGWEESETVNQNITSQGLKRRSKLEDDIDDFFAVSDTIQHQGSGAEQYQKGNLRPKKDKTLPRSQTVSVDRLNFNDEPLSLNSEEIPLTKLPLAKIMAASITVIILGLIGYGISQFEELSQDPVWRPRLAVMCGIFQCKLPATHDTKYLKLTSSNMTTLNDKLEVNAVIYNTNSHFEMPFPDVVVFFFDLDQKLIAELEVRPNEYRQGEIARMKYLPTNTSAHITFLLKNPSNGTLNYEIKFRYPDNLDTSL